VLGTWQPAGPKESNYYFFLRTGAALAGEGAQRSSSQQ